MGEPRRHRAAGGAPAAAPATWRHTCRRSHRDTLAAAVAAPQEGGACSRCPSGIAQLQWRAHPRAVNVVGIHLHHQCARSAPVADSVSYNSLARLPPVLGWRVPPLRRQRAPLNRLLCSGSRCTLWLSRSCAFAPNRLLAGLAAWPQACTSASVFQSASASRRRTAPGNGQLGQ